MTGERDLDPETIRLLKDFVRGQQEEERQKKLDKVLEMLEKSKEWQVAHDLDDKANFKTLQNEMRGISMRVGAVEDDVAKINAQLDQEKEDTLSGLKAELAKEKEKKERRQELKEARRYNSVEWLKQNRIPILISAASLAVAAYEVFFKK